MNRAWGAYGLVVLLGMTAGCTQKMANEPRYDPLAPSDFFSDGMSARPVVPDTVAQGQLHSDQLLYAGKVDGKDATVFPFPVTRQVLDRGRERYHIFCAPCHGTLGNGDGVVVRRGMRGPPSYHTDKLREAPAGHFFDVITNGFGAMASYGSRIPAPDRWAIIAYVRALQLSQNATLADVPPAARERLQEAGK